MTGGPLATTARAAWRSAVASPRFPRHLAVQRGTLLALARVMSRDGRICEPRDRLCEVTGLPRSTLIRHLAGAVAAGWLAHPVRGQKGQNAVYEAAVPAGSATHLRVAERPFSDSPVGSLNGRLSDSPGGSHITETEPAGEGVALNSRRDRRTDPDGGRVPGGSRAGEPPDPVVSRTAVPGRPSPTGRPGRRSPAGRSAVAQPRTPPAPDPQQHPDHRRAAAAAHQPHADVAASRGDHHHAPPPARDPAATAAQAGLLLPYAGPGPPPPDVTRDAAHPPDPDQETRTA